MLEQGLVLASVIRKWYTTVCYELCLQQRMPAVRIAYDNRRNSVGAVQLGLFEPEPFRITIHTIQDVERGRAKYLLTLLHEARHAYQLVYRAPASEEDCDDWAARFIKRRRGAGPVCEPYVGPIEGEPLQCECGDYALSLPCRSCDARLRREAEVRGAIAQAEREEQQKAWMKEQRRLKDRRDLQKAAELARKKHGKTIAALRALDNHPDNGREGCWCLNGNIWVYATSANEAVNAAAHLVGKEIPEVRYLGLSAPPRIQRAIRDQRTRPSRLG